MSTSEASAKEDPKPMRLPIPAQPSELIKFAIRQLKYCRQDSRCRISLYEYGQTMHGDCRVVGLAGSIIAKWYGLPKDISPDSPQWTEREKAKLWALKDFSRGEWERGLKRMGFQAEIARKLTTPFQFDLDRFEIDMLKAADTLEEAGM